MSSRKTKMLKKKAVAQIRTVEEILRRWDPIGILPGDFAPADEYDDYAPHVVSLVAGGISIEQLTQHLENVRTQVIGVEANRDHDCKIAKAILRSLRFKIV